MSQTGEEELYGDNVIVKVHPSQVLALGISVLIAVLAFLEQFLVLNYDRPDTLLSKTNLIALIFSVIISVAAWSRLVFIRFDRDKKEE
jgi:hypothetical protein